MQTKKYYTYIQQKCGQKPKAKSQVKPKPKSQPKPRTKSQEPSEDKGKSQKPSGHANGRF
jgi:hypothetical protein